MLFNTDRLRLLIVSLSKLESPTHNSKTRYLNTTNRPTSILSSYTVFCRATLIFILSYGIAENVLNDLQKINEVNKEGSRRNYSANNETVFQGYFWKAFTHLNSFISYNIYLAVLLLAIVKCGTYGWIFGDILVIVLCRALSEKLERLNDQIVEASEEILFPIVFTPIVNPKRKGSMLSSNAVWVQTEARFEKIRKKFLELSDLVLKMQSFISPLILSCYGINMYLIIIHVCIFIEA